MVGLVEMSTERGSHARKTLPAWHRHSERMHIRIAHREDDLGLIALEQHSFVGWDYSILPCKNSGQGRLRVSESNAGKFGLGMRYLV
jgi:hypothetical protein